MKTVELIAMLAADTTPQPDMVARLWRTLPVAFLISFVALVTLWHVRPDLASALASPSLIKTVLPGVLAIAAFWLARGMARPEARVRAQWAVVMLLAAGSALALGLGLAKFGMSGMITAMDTPNLITCFASIPVLSALPLVAVFWALKSGAPANTRTAGAAAGLLAGALGTMIYSFHCPEDSILFFLPAYGLNMLIVMAAGAALGPRYLRW